MIYHCPACHERLRVAAPIDEDYSITCPRCDWKTNWSDEFIVPYCYTCESEEIVSYLKTPIGYVYACASHREGLGDFWLLPWKPVSAQTQGHARQYDGSFEAATYCRTHVDWWKPKLKPLRERLTGR